MNRTWMKTLAAGICLPVLLTAALPARGEESTDPETETTAAETEPLETETDPVETEPSQEETEPSETETEPVETEPMEDVTEPTEYARLRTFISLQMEGDELVIAVADENGEPVPQAPLTLYLDGQLLTLTADGEGNLRYAPESRPIQISCVLPPFGGYESASASLVLEPEGPEVPFDTPSESVTEAPTRPTTTLGPVMTWTNGPAEEVTVIETAAGTEALSEPDPTETEETVPSTVAADATGGRVSRKVPLMLIILGAALLAAGALILFLFLKRRPAEGPEQEEPEEETDLSETGEE